MKVSLVCLFLAFFQSLSLAKDQENSACYTRTCCQRTGNCLQIDSDQETIEEVIEYFEAKSPQGCCMIDRIRTCGKICGGHKRNL